MGVGDVREVTTGDCSDLYYVDTGMYGTAEYGAVYVLDGDRPAVVDTGIGTNHDLVLEALAAVGVDREDLAAICVTHVHLDHAGGAGFLADACPNADVYVHEIGAPHLADPSRLVAGTKQAVGDQWEFYAEPEPVPEERIVEIGAGNRIDLGAHELRVHEAPGHAPHQVVFEDPADDAVFTADAAGIWVPSVATLKETTPPPQFDLEQALADAALLSDLERSTLLFTHFGPRETGDALERYETVLAEWVEAVETKREELADDQAVLDHFAAATEMGEVWGERKARAEAKMNVRGVLAYLDREE